MCPVQRSAGRDRQQIKAIEMVDRMTGSEDCPTAKTCEILRPKPSKDNSILEQFLGTKGQSSIQLFVGREKGMEKHAYENRKNRRANHREESS